MGFPIPIADPGPPLYGQPPDNIRSSTLVGLLERDRYIYAYSRRCLVKVGGVVAEVGAPVGIRGGYCRTSSIVTGNLIVVATGFDCTFALQIGANAVAITLGAGFDSYRALKLGWVTGGAVLPFAITLYGSPGRLYGLAVYEQRLDEADLPA
jgi:hypothetical protein